MSAPPGPLKVSRVPAPAVAAAVEAEEPGTHRSPGSPIHPHKSASPVEAAAEAVGAVAAAEQLQPA